jgi:Tfp pilus assembly protein PilO
MGTDRTILFVIPLIALLLAFYFMVLGPKREEAAKLDDDIKSLQSQIDTQEQTAAFAEEARQDFPKYYGRLVVLGKAVPEEADSASLLVQLNGIAERSDVSFEGLLVASGTGDAASAGAAPAPAAPATPPAEGEAAPETTPASTGTTTSTDPTATPTTPTPATEATAATLPIGATVGTAGLPTLPYSLTFRGSFFDIADFFAGVDGLIDAKGTSSVAANGRLVTVDGFVLKGGRPGASPDLDTTLAVTTYITPPEQGLTGGATPGGPSLAPPATTTPATVAP